MDKIKVGVIANTHGLKGELKVKSFSDFNEQRFAKGNTLLLDIHKEMLEVTISTYREQKGLVYISFEGMDDINMVEKFKCCDLYVLNENLHPLKSNEVYYYQLMNCDVYDENHELIGNVEDVFDTGANAVLRVNKTILIPYVKAIIKEVDVETKRIVIHKMEGLL